MLLSKNVHFQLSAVQSNPKSRFLFVKGVLEDRPITLVYAPNSNQLAFIEETFSLLRSFQEGDVIVGGNLNLIVKNLLDRSHHSWKQPKYTNLNTQLADLFQEFHLIWRHQQGQTKDYTYFLPGTMSTLK